MSDPSNPKDAAEIAVRHAVGDGVVSPELGVVLGAAIDGMDSGAIGQMLGDASLARTLLDSGDTEGAQAILDKYREMAAAFGLTPMFDEMMAGVTNRS